ncbi:MAG: hypothetical protein ACPG7F_17055 [Aggregatilineales bacterium]
METDYREEVLASLQALLNGVPDVKQGKAFGKPAFKNGRKVFCFVGGEGIAIKLPEAKVAELVAANDEMKIFEPMEGTQWKGWVEIDRSNADDYSNDMSLLQESIKYVVA